MSKKKRSGARAQGNPALRRPLTVGELSSLAQPTGVVDPRRLGGSIAGPGGSRDRGMTVLDVTDSVLLERVDVATVDMVRAGTVDEQAIFLTLGGRVNKSADQVSVGFVFGPDGAAGLITELLAVADRFGADLLSVLARRLADLRRGGDVDLAFLKAAVEMAMEEVSGGSEA